MGTLLLLVIAFVCALNGAFAAAIICIIVALLIEFFFG